MEKSESVLVIYQIPAQQPDEGSRQMADHHEPGAVKVETSLFLLSAPVGKLVLGKRNITKFSPALCRLNWADLR